MVVDGAAVDVIDVVWVMIVLEMGVEVVVRVTVGTAVTVDCGPTESENWRM